METYDDGQFYICWEPHTDESVMGCGHVFCFGCLKTWCQHCRSKPRCPICNTPFKIPVIMEPNLSLFGGWKFLLRSFLYLVCLIFKTPLWEWIGFLMITFVFKYLFFDWINEEWQALYIVTAGTWFLIFSFQLICSILLELRDRGVVGAVYHDWTQFCFKYDSMSMNLSMAISPLYSDVKKTQTRR